MRRTILTSGQQAPLSLRGFERAAWLATRGESAMGRPDARAVAPDRSAVLLDPRAVLGAKRRALSISWREGQATVTFRDADLCKPSSRGSRAEFCC